VEEAIGGREAAGASEVARRFVTTRRNLQKHTRGVISNSHQRKSIHKALENHICHIATILELVAPREASGASIQHLPKKLYV
jgi:hypothetical protein